jgi:hypothetical protein
MIGNTPCRGFGAPSPSTTEVSARDVGRLSHAATPIDGGPR